ncbi:uncharacterized protein LOC135112826 isoform X1 [Scylla paramamosain]
MREINMERNSSTDSDTYMEDDDYQSFMSSPCLKPLLTIASIAEIQPEADMCVVMGAAAVATVYFMEREHHPKQEGLADVLNMSEMEFFRHLRLTRKSFDDTLDLIHKAYGEEPSGTSLYLGPRSSLYLTQWYLGTQSTYREISEVFGVSQTTVFE